MKRQYLGMALFLILIGVTSIAALCPVAESYHTNTAFLAAAVDVNGGATSVNGTGLTSTAVQIDVPGYPAQGLIVITFTGDGTVSESDEIDFLFQVSYDGGTTYTTDEMFEIDCPADEDASSNIVRHGEMVNLYGISHIRLWKIVNNTTSEKITACNASISW